MTSEYSVELPASRAKEARTRSRYRRCQSPGVSTGQRVEPAICSTWHQRQLDHATESQQTAWPSFHGWPPSIRTLARYRGGDQLAIKARTDGGVTEMSPAPQLLMPHHGCVLRPMHCVRGLRRSWPDALRLSHRPNSKHFNMIHGYAKSVARSSRRESFAQSQFR
jgi:hypothetical protein